MCALARVAAVPAEERGFVPTMGKLGSSCASAFLRLVAAPVLSDQNHEQDKERLQGSLAEDSFPSGPRGLPVVAFMRLVYKAAADAWS